MKRIVKIICSSIALLCILFSFPVSAITLTSNEYSMYFYRHGIAIENYKGKDSIVNIPAEYKTLPIYRIDDRAFYNNRTVVSVNVPDSVYYIGDRVFERCYFLESCYLSDSITTMGTNLFLNCTSLKEVVLGGGITSIPHGTFLNCTNLQSVVIPPSITYIASSEFAGLTELTIYGYAGSYAEEYAEWNDIQFVALDKEENDEQSTDEQQEIESTTTVTTIKSSTSAKSTKKAVKTTTRSKKTSKKSGKKTSNASHTTNHPTTITSSKSVKSTNIMNSIPLKYCVYSAIGLAVFLAVLVVIIIKCRKPFENSTKRK